MTGHKWCAGVLAGLVLGGLASHHVRAEQPGQTLAQAPADCYKTFAALQFTEAQESCRRAAEAGDAEASFLLATVIALRGNDYTEAVKWLRQAADKGHTEAAFNLGLAYQDGKGVTKDREEAAKWYQFAADLGFAKAQRNLATLYELGEGVAPDLQRARFWYQKAAEQGDAESQLQLGLMYVRGKGVTADPARGIPLIEQAAATGSAGAQYALGVILLERDPQASVAWYERAAEQGNAYAMHNLAILYFQGEAVPQDLERAWQFAEQSVQAGLQRNTKLMQLIDQAREAAPSPSQEPDRSAEGEQVAVVEEPKETALDSVPETQEAPVEERDAREEPLEDEVVAVTETAVSPDTESASAPEVAARAEPAKDVVAEVAEAAARPVTTGGEAASTTTPLFEPGAEALQAETRSAATAQVSQASVAGQAEPFTEDSVATRSTESSTEVEDPAVRWLMAQKPGDYVVQLAQARAVQGIKGYIERHGLADQARYYRTQKPSGPVYVLLYGHYSSYSEAKEAVSRLPNGVLSTTSPWIRRVSNVQQQYRRP